MNNFNRTCVLTSLFIGAVLLGGSTARASLVSYSFTAQLQSAPFANFNAGDSLSGSFNLDTTATAQVQFTGVPIQNAADFSAIQSLTISFQNFTWTGSTSDILTIHHHLLGSTSDLYNIFSSQPGGSGLTDVLGRSVTPSVINIELSQSAGTLFSDASILPLAVTLNDFDGGTFSILFRDSAGHSDTLSAFLTSYGPITTTPLPGAVPLFATGLGVLGLLGWRRKRKASD